MKQKFVRIAQLTSSQGREGILPVSAPTIWRWVREGKFPRPLSLGPKITAWRSEDIEQWLAGVNGQADLKPKTRAQGARA